MTGPASESPRRRWAEARWLRAVLLLLVLGFHLGARLHSAAKRPPSRFAFYPEHYVASLSLLAHRGFGGFDLEPPQEQRPEAEPIRSFLVFGRDTIAPSEFEAYLKRAIASEAPPVASSRILDLYVAAGVWKLFGIRWSSLLTVYAVFSTLVCLLVFGVGRSVGGGFWPGLFAATLFAASPFETVYASYSVRDISPLWFDTIAFASLIWIADRPWARWAHLLGFFGLGVIAMLGAGWRTDGFLLPPIIIASGLFLLTARGRGAGHCLGAALLAAVGAWLTWQGIRLLGPSEVLPTQIGFHVGYYGNDDRSNLIGMENAFQTLRDDGQAFYHAAYYADVSEGVRGLSYGTPDYGVACRRLYGRIARYDAFNWLSAFPRFYWRALGGLSPPDALQGQSVDERTRDRIPWLAGAYRWLLDPLVEFLPSLFVLGAFAVLCRSVARPVGAILVAFSVLYAAIWFVVLPENKHMAPMLLPLSVVGAQAIAGLGSIVDPNFRASAVQVLKWRPPRAASLSVVVVLGTIAALVLAARVTSLRERKNYIDAILSRARGAVIAPETLEGAQKFSVTAPPGATPDPVGYLLTIETGREPGYLVCEHRRGLVGKSKRTYVTRHKLHPLRTQYFFVTLLQGMAYGDGRPYSCTVTLGRGARIVKSQRMDLSAWGRPLFSSVFYEGEESPGSPRLDPGILATEPL